MLRIRLQKFFYSAAYPYTNKSGGWGLPAFQYSHNAILGALKDQAIILLWRKQYRKSI